MKITIEEPIDHCIEELPADHTSSIIIRIVSRAGSITSPEQGTFISSFDPMFNKDRRGSGHLRLTWQPSRAKRFNSLNEAFRFYQQQSPTVPLRPDGDDLSLTTFALLGF